MEERKYDNKDAKSIEFIIESAYDRYPTASRSCLYSLDHGSAL